MGVSTQSTWDRTPISVFGTTASYLNTMKTIALLLLVCVAAASAQFGRQGHRLGGRTNTVGGVRAGPGFGPGPFTPVNYGPKVYGPGAKNSWALPPNPVLMQRALRIANQAGQNLLVFLDTDGSIEFRDRFGREAEVLHPLGFDLSELIEQ